MAEVELEAPELDVDEEADRFRRLVAVIVVLITLFGAVVAYAQSVESNDEDIAARDAQRHAIEGLGAQVDASTALAADLQIGSDVDALLQREALNAARVEAISGDADSDVHLAARERLAAVAQTVADLTPVDPADGATVAADIAERDERPDQARLRQAVEADLANDHGSKADTYVAILTVLAVALFLLGLSLTVEGRNRYVLVAPGVAVAVVCVGWAAMVYGRGVTEVSEVAIADVAAGQRLENTGDLEGAIARYDEAIEDSPDFAAAFARRASARFLQGSPQSGQTAFLSFTSPEALEDAVADLDQALSLGASSDVVTVADAGFFNFLAGDFERSVDLTTQALDLNDSLAAVWFNLGVAQVALGDDDAAEEAYDEGIDVLADEPSLGRRSQVLAGARTDLSIVRDLLDDDDLDDVIDLVRDIEARLAGVELEIAVCGTEPCDGDEAEGAELGEVTFSRTGASVFAELAVEDAPDGADLGVAWYFRGDREQPFEQAALSFQGVEVVGGTAFASTIPVLDPACPVSGEYLVRVYAGGEFIGEAAAAVAAEVETIEVGDDGEPGVGSVDIDAGTPLGSTFTSLLDPVEGFEACVPEGFIVEEADVSALDAFTTYGPATGELLIGINVTPGSIVDDQDGEALERQLAEGVSSDLFDVDLQGRDLEGGFVFLPGTAAIGESGPFLVGTVVAVGPDNTTRTILITADPDFEDMEALLLEVAGTVTFTGVDTSAA